MGVICVDSSICGYAHQRNSWKLVYHKMKRLHKQDNVSEFYTCRPYPVGHNIKPYLILL